MSERLMAMISNIVRVGIVDGVDSQNGTVRVTFPDRDNLVADELALLSSEQNYPGIGESVLCLFLPNGIQTGFCLGSYFNEENPPPVPDENFYVKELDDGLTIEYDKETKKLAIKSVNEITIYGDLNVTGSIKGG